MHLWSDFEKNFGRLTLWAKWWWRGEATYFWCVSHITLSTLGVNLKKTCSITWLNIHSIRQKYAATKPPAPMWSKTSLGGKTMSRHRPNKHFGETTGVAKHAVSSTAWSERWAPAKHERRTILVVDHPLKSLPTPHSYSLFFHDLG